MDGNRNVAYLNEDDNGRNLNLNWIDNDNDWNSNYMFLVVSNSIRGQQPSLLVAAVSLSLIFSMRQYPFRFLLIFLKAFRVFCYPNISIPKLPV